MKLINKPAKLLAKGFTLAELVVSIAITVILLTVLIALANLATTSLETATSSVQRSDSAQSYLEHVTTDLQNVVIKPGSDKVWLYVGKGLTAGSQELNANSKGKGSLITNNAALYFFTAASDRYDGQLGSGADEGGDVSAVSYEIRCLNPNNTMSEASNQTADAIYDKVTFNGYRSLVNPDSAYKKMLLLNVQDSIQGNDSDGLLSTNSKELNGTKDVICDGLFELTCVFQVEYSVDDSDPATADLKEYKTVIIKPDATAGEGLGTEAKITGRGFKTDATITPSSAGSVYNLKAKSITVILNVMDKNTQRVIDVRDFKAGSVAEIKASREKVLNECRTYTTTVQLP